MKIINNDWDEILAPEFNDPYYQNLRHFLDEEYRNYTIYPKAADLYNALRFTSFADTKVVILGQDPYHEPNQAYGLAFSVKKGVKVPPSLVNIYKELHDDLGCYIPTHGELTKWARQGVLLLNATLTVREHQANSHRNKGWERLTDAIITSLNQKETPVVFLLWGNNARQKKKLITNPNHLILECAHPSPLSAYNGFFGCRHFSKTNAFLKEHHLKPIDWQIEEPGENK